MRAVRDSIAKDMTLIQSPAWKALSSHFDESKQQHMLDLFAADPKRFDKFSIQHGNLLLDYSKNRINEKEELHKHRL